MQAELFWGGQAREDLIERRVAQLAGHPRLGPQRHEIRSGMRVLVEGNYLILYELRPDLDSVSADRVDIVRIVDGRRNLVDFFSAS